MHCQRAQAEQDWQAVLRLTGSDQSAPGSNGGAQASAGGGAPVMPPQVPACQRARCSAGARRCDAGRFILYEVAA